MLNQKEYPWLKGKGYLHITPKIDESKAMSLAKRITSRHFVAKHSFFPLIHSSISERRYRLDDTRDKTRRHTKTKHSVVIRNAKVRPIHYATHIDAQIFAYYAYNIYNRYEKELKKDLRLDNAVLAYRKIETEVKGINKGTIHFAEEVFTKIKERAKSGPVVVLKFDITSFFSHMDHNILKKRWLDLFSENGKLPPDHFNVFRAATNFSYILKDDLRLQHPPNKRGKRLGFNESKLSKIRKEYGIQSYFSDIQEFRTAVKRGEIKIYKNPFRNDENRLRGIPQGLPISAVLANLYLLEFDKTVLEKIGAGSIYRRYSDDIIVVCDLNNGDNIELFIRNSIKNDCKVEISSSKTERFLFHHMRDIKGENKLQSIKMTNDFSCQIGFPFTYLGFDFWGHRTTVKNSNLAKFYRRLIKTTRRKCKYAHEIAAKTPGAKPILFRRQLHRLYTSQNLSRNKIKSRKSKLILKSNGEYKLISTVFEQKHKSNYLTYINRAANILNEPRLLDISDNTLPVISLHSLPPISVESLPVAGRS